MKTPATTSQSPNMVFNAENFEFVDSQSHWNAVARSLAKQSTIAFDLESNGYHRYPDRICLIQIASPDQVYLIDPFALQDLSELGKILGQPKIRKVFHSCENDLRALDRDYGFRVRSIFDTSVAAHFLGSDRRGLSNVLMDFMGITLSKSKTLQRQDWTVRPLAHKALNYAAGDVALLIPLYEKLSRLLRDAGRFDWVDEELVLLERIKADDPVPPETLFWSVKGSRELTDRQRAILKELVLFRDQFCREMDRTPFRVIGDEVLLTLSKKPDVDLKKTKGLAVVFHQKRQKSLRTALQKGKQAPPIPLPPRKKATGFKKKGEQYTECLKKLKLWRIGKGQTLGMDPALLWPMVSLELFASNAALETAFDGVRQWQRREFEKEILALLTGTQAGSPSKASKKSDFLKEGTKKLCGS